MLCASVVLHHWEGMCCFASIESEDYILNDFLFLGCLRRSNNPLRITIRFINSELQTTQPQQPTEVNGLNWCFVDLDGLDTTSPFFFSLWSGWNQSIFLFSMVWMKPVHFSFLYGLDATSPFFFCPWSGCNQSIFLFSMVWMQPVHFSFCFAHGLLYPGHFCQHNHLRLR